MDVHQGRLDMIHALGTRLVQQEHLPATITKTTDRRTALDGADYVVCSIQVGGLEMYEPDVEIPRRYGIDQTVGDTLGPGGVFRGLRTIPVLVSIGQDMEELCPHALFINYSNPMNMNMWGFSARRRSAASGCATQCKGLPDAWPASWTSPSRRSASGAPASTTRHGTSTCARTRRRALPGPLPPPTSADERSADPGPGSGALRGDAPLRLLRHRVLAPHERVRPLVPHHQGVHRGVHHPRWDYFEICKNRHDPHYDKMERQARGEEPVETQRTHEYCSFIVNSMETNTPYVMNANVPNTLGRSMQRNGGAGSLLISNLPPNCNVEVPCLVDGSGVRPAPSAICRRRVPPSTAPT